MQGLTVSPSPHIHSRNSTRGTMLLVLIALLPSVVASGIIFGGRAITLIAVTSISAVIFEYLSRLIMKKNNTIGDLSAVVTGVLLAMNFPVTLPYWVAIIGSFIAIVIVKQLFGGLGQNFANPAIVARIVLMLSFTSMMTNWVKPFYHTGKELDMVTQATPLVDNTFSYMDLFLGKTGGCLGEVCALTLLIGGLFLVATKVISPVLPVTFVGTVALLFWIVGEDPLYQILSGGLLLGAIFMATDYVTSPITTLGKFVAGLICGLVTFVIRYKANMVEGVSFSILIMNILVPYIDMFTRSTPIGKNKPKKEKATGGDK